PSRAARWPGCGRPHPTRCRPAWPPLPARSGRRAAASAWRRPGAPAPTVAAAPSWNERRPRDGGGLAPVPLGVAERGVDLLERILVRDELLERPARPVADQEVERPGNDPGIVHDDPDDLLGAPHELGRLEVDLGAPADGADLQVGAAGAPGAGRRSPARARSSPARRARRPARRAL